LNAQLDFSAALLLLLHDRRRHRESPPTCYGYISGLPQQTAFAFPLCRGLRHKTIQHQILESAFAIHAARASKIIFSSIDWFCIVSDTKPRLQRDLILICANFLSAISRCKNRCNLFPEVTLADYFVSSFFGANYFIKR
jgi:hypothetical protein